RSATWCAVPTAGGRPPPRTAISVWRDRSRRPASGSSRCSRSPAHGSAGQNARGIRGRHDSRGGAAARGRSSLGKGPMAWTVARRHLHRAWPLARLLPAGHVHPDLDHPHADPLALRAPVRRIGARLLIVLALLVWPALGAAPALAAGEIRVA